MRFILNVNESIHTMKTRDSSFHEKVIHIHGFRRFLAKAGCNFATKSNA